MTPPGTPAAPLSEEQIVEQARCATYVDAQTSPVGALLYLLQHEGDEPVRDGLVQAIRELQQRRAVSASSPCPNCADLQQQVDVLKPGGRYAWKERAEAAEQRAASSEAALEARNAEVQTWMRDALEAQERLASSEARVREAVLSIKRFIETSGKSFTPRQIDTTRQYLGHRLDQVLALHAPPSGEQAGVE